ncbi:hypothetical protein FIH39_02345 [Salmonella enterica subsp. enterica]|nr:hypothetical protein [Salmonella enterica subsp. enterica serovar Colorado]EBF9479493.1 hypothetical protein [Salmonella enterica subsp. enterica serovar Nigeria]EBV2940874.1 hypothetical protein [Salmonella enterica subsp. enterica serovar Woodhull]EBW2326138.1 hypothetical protein [Salmonella enterica subsp. enterica serovar Agoueve]ECD7290850.1 hypothetical protein [Salmonella enterica subsp. enterica serovar Agbeni]EDR1223278.1 hypothetical protein [Salmonella enterica subsp. enterica s
MLLRDYIKLYYKTNVAFAKAVGVSKSQVSQWIASDFMVCQGKLVSPRRDLPVPPRFTKTPE